MDTILEPNIPIQSAFTYRLATPGDVALIQSIAHDNWPDTFGSILSPEQITYELETHYALASLQAQMDGGHQFLLVTPHDEDEPQGFLSWSIEESTDGDVAVIHKLYIYLNQKGKGLGRALMNHVESLVSAVPSIQALELNVNRYNQEAIDFYKHLGFVDSHHVDLPSGSFQRNDLVMRKSLTQ